MTEHYPWAEHGNVFHRSQFILHGQKFLLWAYLELVTECCASTSYDSWCFQDRNGLPESTMEGLPLCCMALRFGFVPHCFLCSIICPGKITSPQIWQPPKLPSDIHAELSTGVGEVIAEENTEFIKFLQLKGSVCNQTKKRQRNGPLLAGKLSLKSKADDCKASTLQWIPVVIISALPPL